MLLTQCARNKQVIRHDLFPLLTVAIKRECANGYITIRTTLGEDNNVRQNIVCSTERNTRAAQFINIKKSIK
jgi:hypothetical protein